MNLYNSVCGITSTTVIKTTAGFVWGVSVVASGTTAGGVYDAALTSGVSALGPLAFPIPVASGLVPNMPHIGWPCEQGIIVIPGAGQVVNIAYQ